MAGSAHAARLTEAHRRAQLGLGAAVVRLMLAAWAALRPEDLEGSFEDWLRVVRPIVERQRDASSTLAASYLTAYRSLEVGLDPKFVPTLADELEFRRLTTSMLVTGPASVRAALGRGIRIEDAMHTAQTRSARAGMRLALDGGRQTISNTVAADPRAHGWARATSGKACAFCAMLASRGPVYGADTAHFHAHDGCSCSAEPVYDRGAAWPAGAKKYREAWDAAKAQADGADVLDVFRQTLAEHA